MTNGQEKLVQYLGEALAMERALTRVLQEQIAVTPSGNYRRGLETHLRETRDHAQRVQGRLKEQGVTDSPVAAAGIFVESLLGQALALAKAPIDLLRGSGGEEKVLKNAKDAAATEALEIATYTALERLADDLGDEKTARLAREIRAEEERMLELVLGEIPQLTGKVVAADVRGNGSFDVAKTGAGEAVAEAVDSAKDAAATATTKAKKTVRTARKVPGVAQAEGAVKGAVASADDLPIAGYDDRTADEIVKRLPQLSQIDLAKVAAYEGKNQNRTTVTDRVTSLLGDEPWPGYDEQNLTEIRKALSSADDDRLREVAAYERHHKNRAGVLRATEATAVKA